MASFGPFTLSLAMDAHVEGEELPLVVISHGTGSTPWLHRDFLRPCRQPAQQVYGNGRALRRPRVTLGSSKRRMRDAKRDGGDMVSQFYARYFWAGAHGVIFSDATAMIHTRRRIHRTYEAS